MRFSLGSIIFLTAFFVVFVVGYNLGINECIIAGAGGMILWVVLTLFGTYLSKVAEDVDCNDVECEDEDIDEEDVEGEGHE